jgi:hypothetical protein
MFIQDYQIRVRNPYQLVQESIFYPILLTRQLEEDKINPFDDLKKRGSWT